MLENYRSCHAPNTTQSIALIIWSTIIDMTQPRLSGFLHVLKEDGFANIRVPDIGELMRIVVQRNLDIDDFLYQSPAGPITVRDVVYGYGAEIERSGNDFFAHKTGFTRKSLSAILIRCGFPHVFVGSGNLEIVAFAFRNKPNEFTKKLLNLALSNE